MSWIETIALGLVIGGLGGLAVFYGLTYVEGQIVQEMYTNERTTATTCGLDTEVNCKILYELTK